MRLPKLKGFKNRFRVEFQVVNVARLAELFPEGGTVGSAELVGGRRRPQGEPVKVLGNGDLGGVSSRSPPTRSRQRREKIAAAGGTAPAEALTPDRRIGC